MHINATVSRIILQYLSKSINSKSQRIEIDNRPNHTIKFVAATKSKIPSYHSSNVTKNVLFISEINYVYFPMISEMKGE